MPRPRVVTAPDEHDGPGDSLFLAGGITNAPVWQDEMIALLGAGDHALDERWTLVNPRRVAYPDQPDTARLQIEWEHRHLRRATALLFWFPCETLCPITLYELGAWSMRADRPLFVGVHPAYARRLDVEIQTRLARPEVVIAPSLTALAERIKTALAVA